MGNGEGLKILYAATLTENDSSLYRMWVLERTGHRAGPFQALDYWPEGARIAATGRERAIASGYSNDAQAGKIVERISAKLEDAKTGVRG